MLQIGPSAQDGQAEPLPRFVKGTDGKVWSQPGTVRRRWHRHVLRENLEPLAADPPATHLTEDVVVGVATSYVPLSLPPPFIAVMRFLYVRSPFPTCPACY